MPITAEIKEVRLEPICDQCESNGMVDIDFDNIDLESSLSGEEYIYKQGKRPYNTAEYYPDIFVFCDEDCFKEWCEAKDCKPEHFEDLDWRLVGLDEFEEKDKVELFRRMP